MSSSFKWLTVFCRHWNLDEELCHYWFSRISGVPCFSMPVLTYWQIATDGWGEPYLVLFSLGKLDLPLSTYTHEFFKQLCYLPQLRQTLPFTSANNKTLFPIKTIKGKKSYFNYRTEFSRDPNKIMLILIDCY